MRKFADVVGTLTLSPVFKTRCTVLAQFICPGFNSLFQFLNPLVCPFTKMAASNTFLGGTRLVQVKIYSPSEGAVKNRCEGCRRFRS